MLSCRPIIGITMGDPAGIGPEIIVKALNSKEIYEQCRPIVIGDSRVMIQALKIASSDLELSLVTEVSSGKFEHGTIDVLDMKNIDPSQFEYGKISTECGRAAGQYIEKAVSLAMQGEIDAIVTAPIHKEAFQMGGYKFPGHTEFLAHLTNTTKYTMMLAHGNFRVVHVTTHVSLRKVPDLIKREKILDTIRIANDACKQLGIEKPRIAVSGLNPHASDGGLFGDEDLKEIAPAVEDAKKEGMVVEGPIPPDTVFSKVRGGQYDVGVAMYHDQGHIPMKLSAFVWNEELKKWEDISGVNITFGLPIIRVSVDHGVAFDRAGKGTAVPASMIEAIQVATQLAHVRMQRYDQSS